MKIEIDLKKIFKGEIEFSHLNDSVDKYKKSRVETGKSIGSIGYHSSYISSVSLEHTSHIIKNIELTPESK